MVQFKELKKGIHNPGRVEAAKTHNNRLSYETFLGYMEIDQIKIPTRRK